MKTTALVAAPIALVVALAAITLQKPTLADEVLVLKPNVTERGQKPETWTLDLNGKSLEQAQADARKLSSRLYGTAEPNALHAPLVIKTEGASKIFGFGLASASRSGAAMETKLNGQTVWKKSWPAVAATHNINTVYYFALPTAAAEISLQVTDARGVVALDALYLADAADQLPGKTEKIEIAAAATNAPAVPAARTQAATAQANPTTSPKTVDGYRGIWFALGKKFQYGDKYSGGLGTYTANHQPLAVYSAQTDKTFFVYGGTTAKDERHLLCMAGIYDHKTNRVSRPVVVFDKQDVNDPHDNPSINIDDKGYLWVFVSGRAKLRPGLKFRSKEPYSLSGFEQISSEEMTYPQLWHGKDGFFHLFTKYENGRRNLFWETSADGRTWSADQKLASFGGHYQTSGQSGSKIGTFFNYHPGGDVDKRTNLYYAQTTDNGKTWTAADGKPLALPLAEVKNDALVIDLQAQGKLMYSCDLNWDKNGNPILLYVSSRFGEPGPQGDPREFTVTHWDGTQWQTSRIAPTDHNYDMGSLYVNGDEWSVIAPTQSGPQKGQAGGEMARWASRDNGKTWTQTRQITSKSTANHNYARRPQGAHDPFFAFWADGNPDALSESRLYFSDSSGEHVYQMPYEMTGDWAAPIAVKATP